MSCGALLVDGGGDGLQRWGFLGGGEGLGGWQSVGIKVLDVNPGIVQGGGDAFVDDGGGIWTRGSVVVDGVQVELLADVGDKRFRVSEYVEQGGAQGGEVCGQFGGHAVGDWIGGVETERDEGASGDGCVLGGLNEGDIVADAEIGLKP